MRNIKGVSLIELLVALGILAAALTPMLSLFLHSLRTTENANKRTIATNLARDLQEEIRSKAFAETNQKYYSNYSTYFPEANGLPQRFGCEECGTKPFFANMTGGRYAYFNDVDDYAGYCEGRDCADANCRNDALVNSLAEGVCGTNKHQALAMFDGTKMAGAGYGLYAGFTRSVDVWNIQPNISSLALNMPPPITHKTQNSRGKEILLNFYDLRESSIIAKRTTPTTRLKVIKVTVAYTGKITPDIKVEDIGLAVMPIKAQ